MGETIESFVAKLQAEGVQAGQTAAEKIVAEAKLQAEEIIKQAEAQAAKTISQAETQAAQILQRSRSEMDLAARDVILKLRDALDRALAAVLEKATTKVLVNDEFLANTLHDLVMLYAKADIAGNQRIEINISSELQGKLADWAMKEISSKAEESGISIELLGSLAGAGFEYSVSGATVEVTPESVVEVLKDMVNPRLREIIDSALARQAQCTGAKKS